MGASWSENTWKTQTAAQAEQAEFDRGFWWGTVTTVATVALFGTLAFAYWWAS